MSHRFSSRSLLKPIRRLAKQAFRRLGYDVSRLSRDAGSAARSVGDMRMLLEDLRARGLFLRSILDVGANRGHWSRMAKDVFPTVNCFLLEPQIEMSAYLEAFCQEFPGSQWFLAGAGACPGELILTIWDDLAGSSFLPPESEKLQGAGKQRRVPIITINSLIENGAIPMPQLVKLDIQGFELEALRGGQLLFGSTEVFILESSLFRFIKGWPLLHEVIAFMADRGYFVYDFPGFLRRPYDGALGQTDICFVKHNGLLRAKDNWSLLPEIFDATV